VKLSIVILCWNDKRLIENCLRSIYATTRTSHFEVIVSDNGSTDGSLDLIRENYRDVRLIENGRNLRFAKANNAGIRASRGEYILILNPDTLIHAGTLDQILTFADRHPHAAAFGCRVLNSDGSHQVSARPFSSIRGDWIAGLCLRSLARLTHWAVSDTYVGWDGTTERPVDWITGCFMLIRAEVLKSIAGFDEQFFYYYEDMDLCRRIWLAGHMVLYTPEVSITHLKGQSTNERLPPITFALDSQITRYLYYYKYQGRIGVRRARRAALVSLAFKRAGYTVAQILKPLDATKRRLESLRVLFQWHWRVDPIRLVENGEEPPLNTPIPGRVLER